MKNWKQYKQRDAAIVEQAAELVARLLAIVRPDEAAAASAAVLPTSAESSSKQSRCRAGVSLETAHVHTHASSEADIQSVDQRSNRKRSFETAGMDDSNCVRCETRGQDADGSDIDEDCFFFF